MAKDQGAPEAPKADLRSPDEWARAKGHFIKFKGVADAELGTGDHYSWQHAVAVVMHGWKQHEAHEGGPLLLSERDYLAALDAAAPAKGLPQQHAAAASKHAPPVPAAHKPLKE
ncbi:MAG: hypothetical protein AMXMBFR56_76830 [Polyangiaceae bacterium]